MGKQAVNCEVNRLFCATYGKQKAQKLGTPQTLLQRLAIEPDAWLENMPRIEKDFHHCIGRGDSIKPCAEKLDQCWVKGLGAARRLFGR